MTAAKARKADAAGRLVELAERLAQGEAVSADDVDRELANLVPALPADSARTIRQAVLKPGEKYLFYKERSGDQLARISSRPFVARARAAIDDALLQFHRQDEMDAAERDLADLAGQRQAVASELAAAIDAEDMDRITKLRAELEISLPKRIASAQLLAADLRVERAMEAAALPARRISEPTFTSRQAAQPARCHRPWAKLTVASFAVWGAES